MFVSKLPSIFLIGPEGAGKSTVGMEMGAMLKLPFYDTDAIVAERAGVSISWIYDMEGDEGFRRREKTIIAELTGKPNIILATGGGAVLTPENRTLLAARGLVVYLKATVEQLLGRTHRKEHRPLLQVENVEERLEEMELEREALYESIADLTFSTEGNSIKSIAKAVCAVLRERGY